jgi:hypothetical protein
MHASHERTRIASGRPTCDLKRFQKHAQVSQPLSWRVIVHGRPGLVLRNQPSLGASLPRHQWARDQYREVRFIRHMLSRLSRRCWEKTVGYLPWCTNPAQTVRSAHVALEACRASSTGISGGAFRPRSSIQSWASLSASRGGWLWPVR